MEWTFYADHSPAWIAGASQWAFVDAINVIFFGVLLVCGLTDVFRQRIYDVVTYPAALSGIALQAVGGGWAGAKASLIGFAVGFILFFIVFLFGGLGGGDVKLMAVIGALMGYPFILYASAFTALVGLMYTVVVLVAKGYLWRSLKNVARVIFSFFLPGLARMELDPKESFPIPYGYCISLGTLWAWMLWNWGMIQPG